MHVNDDDEDVDDGNNNNDDDVGYRFNTFSSSSSNVKKIGPPNKIIEEIAYPYRSTGSSNNMDNMGTVTLESDTMTNQFNAVLQQFVTDEETMNETAFDCDDDNNSSVNDAVEETVHYYSDNYDDDDDDDESSENEQNNDEEEAGLASSLADVYNFFTSLGITE